VTEVPQDTDLKAVAYWFVVGVVGVVGVVVVDEDPRPEQPTANAVRERQIAANPSLVVWRRKQASGWCGAFTL